MKYIKRTYTEEVEHSDLDLINIDEILGTNKDGHDYTMITSNDINWSGEVDSINIDTLIATLQKLKKNGANYVEVFHHTDHRGYNIYGVELREATDEEIIEFKNQQTKSSVLEKKIEELESQLKYLKNKLSN